MIKAKGYYIYNLQAQARKNNPSPDRAGRGFKSLKHARKAQASSVCLGGGLRINETKMPKAARAAAERMAMV